MNSSEKTQTHRLYFCLPWFLRKKACIMMSLNFRCCFAFYICFHLLKLIRFGFFFKLFACGCCSFQLIGKAQKRWIPCSQGRTGTQDVQLLSWRRSLIQQAFWLMGLAMKTHWRLKQNQNVFKGFMAKFPCSQLLAHHGLSWTTDKHQRSGSYLPPQPKADPVLVTRSDPQNWCMFVNLE